MIGFKSCTILLLTLTLQVQAIGQLRLPEVISSHMVLQRNSDAALWGWSDPQAKIEIVASWNANDTISVAAPYHGRWSTSIKTPEAGGPHTLTFLSADQKIELNDILIGEVWICSGQSNMEWSVRNGFDNAESEAENALYPKIRFFDVPKTTANFPQDHVNAEWTTCSPETMRQFSAVGYFFGRAIHQELDVPIGLINSSWGGTNAETWIDAAEVNEHPVLGDWKNTFTPSKYWPVDPGFAFNGMIHPIIPFSIKGALWYQGETNTANAAEYDQALELLIKDWRTRWDKEFPFYYVQIAPFNYGTPLTGAMVREAQLRTMQTPHTGMVVISDIGNLYDIHPGNKLDVGKRLADWALRYQYGQKEIIPSGPLYWKSETDGSKVRIFFHYGEGLTFDGAPNKYFEIAGNDQIFKPADEVVIERSYVEVSHPEINNPMAVRYAYSNLAEGNLFNEAGLPASTFRTDDWPIVLIAPQIQIDRKLNIIQVKLDGELDKIYYTLDGSQPSLSSNVYTDPITITRNTTIKAMGTVSGVPSNVTVIEKVLLNKATLQPCELFTNYSPDYPANGTSTLTDGQTGSLQHNDGKWMGFSGENLEAIIDLESVTNISKIETQFLQNHGAWIFAPEEVIFSTSAKGKKFKEVHRQEFFNKQGDGIQIKLCKKLLKKTKARYVKIVAKNIGKCPDWHAGSGNGAWLFVDEVIVE